MTDSPSEVETPPTADAADAPDPAAAVAERIAGLVGSDSWSAAHGTAKVTVARDGWVDAVRAVKDAGLTFFSWLSAVDWSRQVEVGETVAEPDSLEERYEVLCRISSTADSDAVVLSTTVPKDDPRIDSVVDVFGGAGWHERETAEMFGIDFAGHPQLTNLYLPDAFEGYPLRKDYPLLSREVKPWPGTVDVEAMPSTENPEDGGGEEE